MIIKRALASDLVITVDPEFCGLQCVLPDGTAEGTILRGQTPQQIEELLDWADNADQLQAKQGART